MHENASITCCIRKVRGKFHLIAHITDQWYFTLETKAENITEKPLTAKDIREVYPLGTLPD